MTVITTMRLVGIIVANPIPQDGSYKELLHRAIVNDARKRATTTAQPEGARGMELDVPQVGKGWFCILKMEIILHMSLMSG